MPRRNIANAGIGVFHGSPTAPRGNSLCFARWAGAGERRGRARAGAGLEEGEVGRGRWVGGASRRAEFYESLDAQVDATVSPESTPADVHVVGETDGALIIVDTYREQRAESCSVAGVDEAIRRWNASWSHEDDLARLRTGTALREERRRCCPCSRSAGGVMAWVPC